MSDNCPSCEIDINKKLSVDFEDVKAIMKRTNVFYCMECGKCTSTCPVALVNPEFSPRRIVSNTITGEGISILTSKHIYACLTCGLCNDHCPSDVAFVDFIREIRGLAGISGNEAPCSHGGAMQSLMRLMTSDTMNQNRLDWITDDLKISDKGEYALFVGCLPYYDGYFDDLEIESVKIAASAIRILNKMGITPAVSKDERCCGHDLRWAGDDDMFKMLIQRNVEMLKKTGATKIITTCAECYRTLKLDYPDHADFPYEVIHITEFVADAVESGKLKLKDWNKKITYHDPCRLSRHMEVIDPPRDALNAIGEIELLEMAHSKNRSNCCGTSSWMNCDIHSKMIQASRIKEAKDTGAEMMVTSCPKCMIHLKCAQKDPNNAEMLAIEIKDFAEIIAQQVE